MSSWLLEGFLSFGLFFLLLPVVTAPLVFVIYRRYGYAATRPLVLALLAGLYACALFSFTTFPLPTATAEFCARRAGLDYLELVPFHSVVEIVRDVARVGSRTLVTEVLQVGLNVVFFLPLGFLLGYWARRPLMMAAIGGFGVSLVIEASQGTALWGLYPCPYRVADVDDLLTNTAGAVLGWLAALWLSRRIPYRTPERRADLGPPTLPRRVAANALDLLIMVVVVGAAVVPLVMAIGQVADAETPASVANWTAGLLAVALLGLVPLLRRDRATPGQLTVALATGAAISRTGPAELRPAPRWSLVVRFVVRWLPIVVLGPVAAFVILLVELVVVASRRDRRSLAGLLSRSRTVTSAAMPTARTRGALIKDGAH